MSNLKDYSNIVIFGLSASKKLTNDICKYLKIKPSDVNITKFADGEIIVEALDSVRGKEVYIIQSTSSPVNENLMELLIFIDALKRASAYRINVVIPYFGYARQDRKAKGRQPITAKLVANMLTVAGANRIMTVDIHSAQIQGFFEMPFDDIRASQDLAAYIETKKLENIVVVSPDHGGVTRAMVLAKQLNAELAVIDKRRPKPNVAEVQFVLGDIKGKNCIVIDDMIDTGGTIIGSAKALKEKKAKSVYIMATHAIFSGNAKKELSNLIKQKIVEEVIVTDTIEIPAEKRFDKLEIVSIAKFLFEMIDSSIKNKSLTAVYNHKFKK